VKILKLEPFSFFTVAIKGVSLLCLYTLIDLESSVKPNPLLRNIGLRLIETSDFLVFSSKSKRTRPILSSLIEPM
jgi:hypothetical protein